MARSPFSIYTRQDKNKKTLFCVRFFDDSGRVVKSVTLWDAKSKSMAGKEASKMLSEGVISDDKNPLALEYMQAFWERGSDYVQLRALRGTVLSEQYMKVNKYLVSKPLAANLIYFKAAREALEAVVKPQKLLQG